MSLLFIDFLIDFFFIFFPVFFILRNKRQIKKALGELGIKHSKPGFLFKKTSVLFLALFGIAFALGIILFLLNMSDTQAVFEAIDSIKKESIFLLFYFLLIRVTGEEIFFRGFLVKRIGIFPSSAIFALMHVFYGSVAEVIGAFVLGIVLAFAFKKNNNLMPNIFAHIFYNFFVIIMAYLAIA